MHKQPIDYALVEYFGASVKLIRLLRLTNRPVELKLKELNFEITKKLFFCHWELQLIPVEVVLKVSSEKCYDLKDIIIGELMI